MFKLTEQSALAILKANLKKGFSPSPFSSEEFRLFVALGGKLGSVGARFYHTADSRAALIAQAKGGALDYLCDGIHFSVIKLGMGSFCTGRMKYKFFSMKLTDESVSPPPIKHFEILIAHLYNLHTYSHV